MITHNGTYLLHATHHGMPIYTATMGGKMVIGDWLLSPTKQAIVAAFGAEEGTEVIRKTNDYLNRIATTDPQRALLLANFINEDPMLVCSLVETSKVRSVTALNNCRTLIDVYTDNDLQIIGTFATNGTTGGTNDTACGSLRWNSSWNACGVGSFIIGFDKRSGLAFCYGTEHTWKNSIYANKVVPNTPYILDADYNRFIAKSKNGTVLITVNNKYYWTPGNELQMGMMGMGTITYECNIYKGGTLIRKIVPYQGKNGECLVDIINGVAYSPSVESPQFTIALTSKTTS